MWVCGSHALVWWHNLNNPNLFVNFPKLQGLLANQVLSHTMQKKRNSWTLLMLVCLRKTQLQQLLVCLIPLKQCGTAASFHTHDRKTTLSHTPCNQCLINWGTAHSAPSIEELPQSISILREMPLQRCLLLLCSWLWTSQLLPHLSPCICQALFHNIFWWWVVLSCCLICGSEGRPLASSFVCLLLSKHCFIHKAVELLGVPMGTLYLVWTFTLLKKMCSG